MKTIILSLLTILIFAGCESSEEKTKRKQVEEYAYQQMIETKRAALRESLNSGYERLQLFGCTIDEVHQYLQLTDSTARRNLEIAYADRYEKYITGKEAHQSNIKFESSEDLAWKTSFIEEKVQAIK